jgi:hypothetical protein
MPRLKAIKHTCGRRGESHFGATDKLNPDRYHEHHGDGVATCSYCGGMSEEDFFRLVEDGATVGPTDKSYKAYVEHPSLRFGKFYFQHLSDDGKTRFIALYNERKMKLGYPGHFYTKPYFARVLGPGEA